MIATNRGKDICFVPRSVVFPSGSSSYVKVRWAGWCRLVMFRFGFVLVLFSFVGFCLVSAWSGLALFESSRDMPATNGGNTFVFCPGPFVRRWGSLCFVTFAGLFCGVWLCLRFG